MMNRICDLGEGLGTEVEGDKYCIGLEVEGHEMVVREDTTPAKVEA